MKPFLFLTMVFLLVSCVNTNEQKSKTKADPEVTELPGDALKFETETHDFGRVQAGEILTFSFVFENSGSGPIQIKDAVTDCGCVSAKIQQNQVNQGESGVVEVTFNSAGLFGRQLKTVEILWNSKELKHLIIFAEVENDQLIINN